jgi:hypothetical protein
MLVAIASLENASRGGVYRITLCFVGGPATVGYLWQKAGSNPALAAAINVGASDPAITNMPA